MMLLGSAMLPPNTYALCMPAHTCLTATNALRSSVSMCTPEEYLNPTDYALISSISICAGNIAVQQDPRFMTLLPNQAQTLPLDYLAQWPIWVVAPPGSKLPVAKVPAPKLGADFGTTWVPPAAFEQMWLPKDLPLPKARAAIGLVLRNGEPRYLFPTLDTFLEADGVTWRNRGLNSVPIASSWMHFGEVPPESLQLSVQALKPPPAPPSSDAPDDGKGGVEGSAETGADESAAPLRAWEPCVSSQPVHQAIDAALDALDALPPLLQRSSLCDGFSFLISPLPSADSGSDGVLLPESTLAPGSRVRVLLSEAAEADEAMGWQRAEADLSMWKLPPGKDSPYMMDVYKELYQHQW